MEREKTREGGRKNKKKAPVGRLGLGLKHNLGVRIYGARIYDAELPVKSPPHLRRAQDLGVSYDGAELRV